MAGSYVYEPYVHNQIMAASTWSVAHNFGRNVNVQVFAACSETGYTLEEVFPDIFIVDDNNLDILFNVAGFPYGQTGKVVVS